MILVEDLADGGADLEIILLVKIGERGAYRPLGTVETIAVEEHDSCLVGEAYHEVERLVIVVEEVGKLLAVELLGPYHQVDLAVVAGAVGIGKESETGGAPQVVETLVDHFDKAGLEIIVMEIGESRENGHLYLLRSGESGGVVKAHEAGIGHEAVNELDLGGFERE